VIPPFDPGSDGVYASAHRNHSFARPSRRRAGPVARGSESRGSSSWHATVKLKDGGDRFHVREGGPGEANVTVSASEETGIVGPSDEVRTLFQIEYSGNVTRDALQLNVVELSDDNFDPISASAVSVTKLDTTDGGDGTDSVSIDSVTVNGNSVTPFLSTAESTGVVVTLQGLSQGDTVRVEYTVSVSSSVSTGTTYTIDGNVTSGTTTELAANQTLVEQGSPLSDASGDYDADFDGKIDIQELGAAAADYARGDIGIQALGNVAATYAQS